jgi:radical SAM superfamily enzyme YgiQ (UPF0313 family)
MPSKTFLLVNPKTPSKYCHTVSGWADQLIVRYIRSKWHRRFEVPTSGRCTSVPPITLFALQALFEKGCRALVVDEQVEPVDVSLPVDLVCLTATTPQITRAAQIAAAFRKRGVPTVIGGIHATCCPGECAWHFDTVCVGEAEAYIEEMLRDLNAGGLKPLYRAQQRVEMDKTPFYDYDVASGKHLPFYAINLSRGCPFHCGFCSIRSTFGTHRTRSVDALVRQLKQTGARQVYVSDASLTANRARVRELLRALVPLNIRWLGSMTLDVAEDEELLDLLSESGCWLASVGFETLSERNLRAAGKLRIRPERFREAINAFHRRHIAVEGNFVFGFDGDCEDVFDCTAAFTIETGIDLPEFYVLTPYPGTPLYQRLCREGRIVDRDWAHYDNAHFRHLPVFEPRNMSREALRAGCRRASRVAYAPANALRRLRNAGIFQPSIWIANYILAHNQRRISPAR